MSELIRFLFLDQAPNWAVAVLIVVVVAQLWRHAELERVLRRHARSITNMDAWADDTDERLERIDWIKKRQKPANDTRRKLRRTG